MNQEPSVLDVVKARLAALRDPRSWSRAFKEDPALPLFVGEPAAVEDSLPVPEPAAAGPENAEVAPHRPGFQPIQWLAPAALALALLAQFRLEPGPDPNRWQLSLLLYLAAFGLLGLAYWRGAFQPAEFETPEPSATDPLTARLLPLLAAGVLAPFAFLAFGNNQFNSLNLGLGLLVLGLTLYALYLPGQERSPSVLAGLRALPGRLRLFFQDRRRWSWGLLLLAAFGVAVFYRAYQLGQVPPEMNSDHAEKLLDVYDVLSGKYAIFFQRNTGREALQFYLIALTAKIFGTGVTFISMKIGTLLTGLLVLPYLYLLGKELAADEESGRWVGLLALLLAGAAAWPNILSRVALRFSLYPLFVAPVLYHLLRGLRHGSRNDFLWAGLFLGLGLHGYTPFRIVPLVILTAFGLAWLHQRSRTQRLYYLAMLALVAFVVFLPLLRYAYDEPESFAYRAFTRLLDWEQPLPAQIGGLIAVFFLNLKNSLLMFGWNAGQIWPVAVTGRPALDILSAALLYLGMGFLLLRYIRRRRWEDLFLLLAVPMLMLPSILSLAFPAENPAPNRSGGAMVPVFLIVALLLEAFWRSLRQVIGRRAAGLAVALLLALALLQNYGLTFEQYRRTYELSSWNTSEMGGVIRDFAQSIGSYDTAWVIPSAHWVDTRLVGIQSGNIARDYALWPDQLSSTLSESRTKLFLLRPDDAAALQTLQQLYPQGYLSTYDSRYENKDFWLYLVVGRSSQPAPAQPAPSDASTPYPEPLQTASPQLPNPYPESTVTP